MSAALQLSFLGREEPSIDPSLPALRRLHLAEGAWVDRLAGWLRGHSVLFEQLRDSVPWECPDVAMYDQMVATPRLVAMRTPLDAVPPIVASIAAVLSRHYATDLTQLGLAYYRDGRDSVAWHTDRDGRNREESLTAIVSVGEPRPFVMRPKGGGTSLRMSAGWGDLIVMGGTCQRTWEHSVPKTEDVAGPRICLMFRHRAPVGSVA